MKYIRVTWKHEFPDEPIMYYSEIDDKRWEVRAVEVRRNGKMGYASKDEKVEADLSERAIPELAEIEKDPQFRAAEITKAEFEEIWERSRRSRRAR